MNKVDLEYFKLVETVLGKGKLSSNRTDTDAMRVFGAQARFDLSGGFPILTSKKIFFRAIVHELLWFLSGSTNIRDLLKDEVHIWDEWAYQRYVNNFGNIPASESDPSGSTPMTPLQFTDRVLGDKEFGDKWGDLGTGTYGSMWREFPHFEELGTADYCAQPIDQISKVIKCLKEKPLSRRHIVSAWHPHWAGECALAPCHVLFQFGVDELNLRERTQTYISSKIDDVDKLMALRKLEIFGENPCSNEVWSSFLDKAEAPKYRLNLHLYQRSADLFLGVPFNISSYSLLLSMFAQVTNMVAGEFIHTFGDLHIYENHLDQIKSQLVMDIFELPKLKLNPEVKNIFDFKAADITLLDYKHGPVIKGEIAV